MFLAIKVMPVQVARQDEAGDRASSTKFVAIISRDLEHLADDGLNR